MLVTVQVRWRPTVLPSPGTVTSTEDEVVQPSSLAVVAIWDTLTSDMAELPEWSLTSHWTEEGGLLASPEQVKLTVSPASAVSGPVRLTTSGPTEVRTS